MKNAFLLAIAICICAAAAGQEVTLEPYRSENTFSEFGQHSNALLAVEENKGGLKFLFGLKAGVASANLDADEIDFTNAGRQFRLAVQDNEFSYHLGVFGQIRINNWSLQPEVLFRSSRADYMLSEFVSTEFVTSLRTEKYSFVDVPIMLAYRFGALRLQAGPVARFYIANSSELVGIADFSESFEQVEYGYQAGIGLDIWRLVIDVKYDRELDDIGDHISFGGQSIDFNKKAGRFLFSVGYSLLKP